MSIKMISLAAALLLSGCSAVGGSNTSKQVSAERQDQTYIEVPEVQTFIDYMASKHQYDRALLVDVFSQIKKREQVITKSNNQPEVITPYYEYRTRFLNQGRIDSGVEFANRNRVWLDKAELEFGVPWPIIVSIIGVETAYGRVTGNRDVFTSLTTLAFDYPRRGKYFRSELESYLLLARQEGWTVGETKGSYSGALGMVQFMPSNYLKLAKDFNGNEHIDLWGSEADAIGSVANYLQHHGWQRDGYTVSRARVDDLDNVEEWVNKGRSPMFTLREWSKLGVWATTDYVHGKAGLVGLRDQEGSTAYWLAYENFFTIMDYNPSRRYAMSVLELANRIAQSEGS
ncbi:lytic murein transglycosylase B [Marinomonas piezotolerans]|nr:lytic murein transglycosylase B [Marinomonas piezotolerans]